MTSNLQPTNQELGSFLTSDDIFSSTAYFSLTSSKNNIEHEVIEENFLHESMHFDMESLSLNLDFLESDFLDNEDTYVSSDEVQSQTTKNEDSVTRSNLSENESEDCTDYDTWVYQAIALEEFLEQFTTHQFSTHAIFEALFLSGGDLQQAAEVILTANNLVEKCRPCRHMLTGKCYRSDCVYDHDLSLFPCRFWMSPIGCIKFSEGQSCPFLHQIPSPYDHSHLYSAYFGTHGNSSNRGDSSEKYKAPALNDTDFPELLSMTTTKGPTGKSINTGSKQSTLSEATKIYKSMFSGHKNDDSRNLKKADSSSGAALSAISEPTSVKLTKAEKQKWLWQGTGKAVSEEYAHYRRDARLNAINRNRLLTAASRAYLSGHRDEAKQLSQRGQEINILMKNAHKEAAHAIFSRRNTAQQLISGHADLHGLHAAEASELLLELLPAFCPSFSSSLDFETSVESSSSNSGMNKALFTQIRAHANEYLLIVTGSGHHTKGASLNNRNSKLFETVKSFLINWNLTFQIVKDGNGYEGAFRISTNL